MDGLKSGWPDAEQLAQRCLGLNLLLGLHLFLGLNPKPCSKGANRAEQQLGGLMANDGLCAFLGYKPLPFDKTPALAARLQRATKEEARRQILAERSPLQLSDWLLSETP